MAGGCIPEAIAPERAVAKAVETLGLILKREGEPIVVLPFAEHDAPNGAAMGMEKPLPWRTQALPVNANLPIVSRIFSHHLRAMRRCRRQSSDQILLECKPCGTTMNIPHSCGHCSCPHCLHHDSQQWIE
jgi:hypothetical protein